MRAVHRDVGKAVAIIVPGNRHAFAPAPILCPGATSIIADIPVSTFGPVDRDIRDAVAIEVTRHHAIGLHAETDFHGCRRLPVGIARLRGP